MNELLGAAPMSADVGADAEAGVASERRYLEGLRQRLRQLEFDFMREGPCLDLSGERDGE